MLIVCLDDAAFGKASDTVTLFNIIRNTLTPEATARTIQGALIAAASQDRLQHHPFIGRETELLALERQVTDPARPPTKALYISGNFGVGRRTIAHEFYRKQYPHVGLVFPEMRIEEFSGLEELHRKVLLALRPSMMAAELRTRVIAFTSSRNEQQSRMIADLLNALLQSREAGFLFDAGGVLKDNGAFNDEFEGIVDQLQAAPHPPVCFISPRMTPVKYRRAANDVAYLAVRAFDHEEAERLIHRLLKDRQIAADQAQIRQLVELSDGHPFNAYRLMDEIHEIGVAAFLANPASFNDWKHRQSSEYLGNVALSKDAAEVLALLSLVPQLDFPAIVQALAMAADSVTDALLWLVNWHLVEPVQDTFIVAPPLRIAVERDKRIELGKEQQAAAMARLSTTSQCAWRTGPRHSHS
jgi:hypothetical protein